MASLRRIVLFGECMIELRGQVFGTMQQGFGGDTLNTAIYLTRLCRDQDIQVCYATALGIDVFSDHMIAAWQAEGIDRAIALKIVIIWIFSNVFFDISSKDIGKNN